jgi:hypothetical protein
VGGTATTQQGQIGGLILSNDGGAPNTKLDISAGYATSDDVSTVMSLGAFSKTTTGTFVAGSGNTGLDTGAIAASTWYAVYLIQNTTTVTNDILFSTSFSAPTMPSGYTVKRRIGAFKTDGSSHILAFTQVNNEFWWAVAPIDVNTSSQGTGATQYTLAGVPPVPCMAHLNVNGSNAAAGSMKIYSPYLTGSLPYPNISYPAGVSGCGQISILTDNGPHIEALASANSTTLQVCTMGYTDYRGQ